MQTLPLMQDIGALMQELGRMQEAMAQLIADVLEQENKAKLCKASQKQLQEFQKRQDLLQEQIADLQQELHTFNDFLKSIS